MKGILYSITGVISFLCTLHYDNKLKIQMVRSLCCTKSPTLYAAFLVLGVGYLPQD